MKTTAPTTVLHRGTVEAMAVLVESQSLGEDEARRRILALWEPGTQVRVVDGGWVVEWSKARAVRVDRALGTVLTAVDEALLALPLTTHEMRDLEIRPRSLVRSRGGRVVVESLAKAAVVDPGEWIAIPDQVVATESLGELPEPLRVDEVVGRDARSVFAKKVSRPDAATARAIDEVRAAAGSGASASAGGGGAGWFAALLATVIAPLAAMFGDRGGPYRSAPSTQLPATGSSNAPGEPSPDWRARLGRWLARFVETVGLARMLGQRQGEYVRRMLDMFASRDWENALRHAIPLGKDGEAKNGSPALGVPSPRKSLQISKGPLVSGSSIGGGGGLYDYLRKIYREAFERLDAAGDYERAAFVLAELLQASEEAVAYLERKGELRLAAEIAEARGLAPDLVVRQWFVAGDRERAVAIARRTGCFAAAVARLERNGRNATADALRHAWASHLARAGNYVMAADVAIAVAAASDDVREWLRAAKAVGGLSRVRALAMELGLGVEPSASDRIAFEEILEDADSDGPAARSMFAQLVLSRDPTPWSRVIARGLARAILRDGATRGDAATVALAFRTAGFADALLGADFPKVPTFVRKPFAQRTDTVCIEIGAYDRGAIAVHDVAAAPAGGVLVALGEAGVRWLTRDGRLVTTFDVPARWLVVSDHGSRVLAITRRGEAFRVSRIDLANRRAETWSEVLITQWAESFDGEQWIVAHDRELLVLDACAPDVRVLRRFDDFDGNILSIARTPYSVDVIAADDDHVERWRFDTPAWTLRMRREIRDFVTATDAHFTVLDDGTEVRVGSFAAAAPSDEPARCLLTTRDATRVLGESAFAPTGVAWWPTALRTHGAWIATALTEKRVARVVVADRRAQIRLEVVFADRTKACVRVQNESAWIADDTGIVLRIGLDSGTLRQRWVVR